MSQPSAYQAFEPEHRVLLGDRWALEVCLDTFGCCLDAPFQALNPSYEECFLRTVRDLPNSQYLIPEPDSILSAITSAPIDIGDFVDWYFEYQQVAEFCLQPLELSLLLSKACYSGPLSRVLRQSNVWKLWEYASFTRFLNSFAAKRPQGPEASQFLISGIRVYLGVIPAPSLPGLIITWPVRALPRETRTGAYVTASQSLVAEFTDALRRHKLEPPCSDDILYRLSNMRGGLTVTDLINRLSIAARALSGLERLSIGTDELLGRGNLQRIAANAVFAATMHAYRQLGDAAAGAELRPAYFFKLPGTIPDAPNPIPDRSLRIHLSGSDDTVKLSIVSGWDDNFQRDCDLSGFFRVIGSSYAADQNFADQLAHLDATFSWFSDTLQTRRNAFDFETLLALETLCVEALSQLGELVSLVQQEMPICDDRNSIGARLIRIIAEAVGSDIAAFHYFDRQRSTLRLIASYDASEGTSLPTERLRSLPADPNSDSVSVIQHAAFSSEPRVCYYFDPISQVSNPPNESLSEYTTSDQEFRSANAMPLNVYGRTWGVLTVAGYRPYQFSSNAFTTLSDLGGILSIYIYHRWMLFYLGNINSIAMNSGLSEQLRYRKMCESICQVLLADASALWVRSLIVHEQFDAVGWAGRPDLDRLLSAHQASRPSVNGNDAVARDDQLPVVGTEWPVAFSTGDPASVSAAAIRGDEKWWQGRIGESPLAGEWLRKQHTAELRSQGFRTVCIVPVQSRGRTRACISLYSKTERLYDSRWAEVIRLVGEEVGLAVEAIEMRNVLEVNLYQPIRHEIVPDLRAIGERLDTLDKLIDSKEIRSSTAFERLALLDGDLIGLYNDVSWRMDNLVHRQKRTPDEFYEDAIVLAARHRKDNYDGRSAPVRQLFNEIAATLRKRYRDKRVSFALRGPSHIRFPLDDSTLGEILRNLMENAAKYSKDSDVIIGHLEEGKPSGYVLSIKNIGAPLQHHEIDGRAIFNRGVRGVAARKMGWAGNGLGLWYVEQLCQLYGMSVRYVAQPASAGLVFHVFRIHAPKGQRRS